MFLMSLLFIIIRIIIFTISLFISFEIENFPSIAFAIIIIIIGFTFIIIGAILGNKSFKKKITDF